MSRRNRTDSQKGAVEIYQGAQETIDPPLNIELGEGVRPYWDKLVKAKAARAWQDQDLLMLVELARNLCVTERLSREMMYEDHVVEAPQGVKANPKIAIIDQQVKRARMIMAMLQIHPEATQGKSHKQVDQNKKHAAAAAVHDQTDDDLIPRQSMQ